MGVNEVRILGNLGQEPDVRKIPSGESVATLTVATNEPYKDRDGNKKDHVEWHRVIVWGKTAEHCGKYLKKGSRVYVAGVLRTRKWKDQQGVERYTTEIKADKVEFLDSKPQDSRPPNNPSGNPQYMNDQGPVGDDVPF